MPPLQHTELAAGIWEYRFKNAMDLVEALQPTHDLWYESTEPLASWVFRGHADATWPLYPSAHRVDSWVNFRVIEKDAFDPQRASVSEQITHEKALLREFYNAVDLAGLPHPVDPRTFDSASQEVPDGWPNPDLVPALALAQHYGVPTRLLDWTRHARNAAYFAAQHPNQPAEDLAIWALHGVFVKDNGPRGYGVKCHLATAPRASNPNLHAQAGIFTYVRFRQDLPPESLHGVTFAPLDHIMSKFVTGEIYMATGKVMLPKKGCVMRKLVLPREEADLLLGLLHLDGITALSMFPGLSGIAPYLKERRRIGLDDPPF
jgi:hypothetical protein